MSQLYSEISGSFSNQFSNFGVEGEAKKRRRFGADNSDACFMVAIIVAVILAMISGLIVGAGVWLGIW